MLSEIGKSLARYRWLIIVLIFFIFIAGIFTWPILTGKYVIWGFPGDNFGSIWFNWWLKYAHTNNLNSGIISLVNYPFGINIGPRIDLELGWSLPLRLLTWYLNPVIAYNLLIFLSFPFSGLAMTLLVFKFTQNKWVSVLGGLLYMLLPFHFWQSYQHLALSQTQWLPLAILALLNFDEDQNKITSFFLGLSVALVMATSIYFGYFLVIFLLVYLLVRIVYSVIKRKYSYFSLGKLRFLILALFIFLITMLPFFTVFSTSIKSSTTVNLITNRSRPLDDLLAFSIRPWDFILPAQDQPYLGKVSLAVRGWIKSLSNDYKTVSAYPPEGIMYVGVVATIFFLPGVYFGLKRKKIKDDAFALLGSLVVLLLVAAPPFIYLKSLKIIFPSYYLYSLFPFIRIYSRLGIFIDLIIIVFATLGVNSLFQRLKTKAGNVFLFSLLVMVIVFDFLNFPPYPVTDITKFPTTYAWVGAEKKLKAFVEYPISYPATDSLLFQTFHQKPFFGFTGYTYGLNLEPLRTLITDLDSEKTGQILASLGINYALVHTKDPFIRNSPFDNQKESYTADKQLLLNLQKNNLAGLKVEKILDDGYLVNIYAEPAKVIVFQNNKTRYFPDNLDWQWSSDSNSILLINISDNKVNSELSFGIEEKGSVELLDSDIRLDTKNTIPIQLGTALNDRIMEFKFRKAAVKEAKIANIKIKVSY